MCLLLDKKEQLSIAAVELNQETKHLLPELLQGMFRKFLPEMAALIISCWFKVLPLHKPPDGEDPRDVKEHFRSDPLARLALDMANRFGLSSDPERKEVLRVEIASMSGDHSIHSAEIIRHPDQPPTLSGWEQPEEFDGRMKDILRNAFRASARKRNRRNK